MFSLPGLTTYLISFEFLKSTSNTVISRRLSGRMKRTGTTYNYYDDSLAVCTYYIYIYSKTPDEIIIRIMLNIKHTIKSYTWTIFSVSHDSVHVGTSMILSNIL